MKQVTNFSLAFMVSLCCFAAGFCAAEAAHTTSVTLQHERWVDGETADERAEFFQCDVCGTIHSLTCPIDSI